MEFKVTSKYNPATKNQTEERYYIDGKRVKPSFFEDKRILCIIEKKSYCNSNATLFMSKKGYALFSKSFCYCQERNMARRTFFKNDRGITLAFIDTDEKGNTFYAIGKPEENPPLIQTKDFLSALEIVYKKLH